MHPPEKLCADDHGDQFLGIQVPLLPVTVTKVAFSISFLKMLMYKTAQSTREPPPPSFPPALLLACFWPELWERQDAKLILGEVTPAHQVPAAPAAAPGEGRESPALPGDTPTPTGPAQLLAFPLCAPGTWVAGVGENRCLPGRTVCQKVGGGGYFLIAQLS